MKWLTLATVLLCALGMAAQEAMNTEDVNKNRNRHEPPVLEPHWSREAAPARAASSSPDMSYHGGPILPSVTIKAIFWGSSWPSYTGDEITGMDKWYSGVGGTSYAASVDEYTDGSGQVTSSITYQGHVVDGSSVPRRLSTSGVLAEVCKVVPKPVASGYYPVYIDKGRGNANFCAYHSWGSCGGTPIEFGFFFKPDGDPGCNPGSTVAGQSEGLAADANVSGHELSETRSDPNGNAWFDSSGAENGDKCAWVFGGPFVLFGSQEWRIQGNWSNFDFDHNTGYANSSGQKGCADGTNFPGPFTR